MRLRPPIVPCLLAAIALVPAPAAASDDGGLRIGDVCVALLIPYPDCPRTIHFDLGLAWERSWTNIGPASYARGFFEAGVLLATKRDSQWHVGPVTEIGFDVGEFTTGWHLTPKLMARLWVESIVTLDGAVGGTFARTTLRDPGVATETRVGAFASAGVTIHGVFGVFIGTEQLFDPYADVGLDHRLFLGVRGTLGFWGVLVYVAAGGK